MYFSEINTRFIYSPSSWFVHNRPVSLRHRFSWRARHFNHFLSILFPSSPTTSNLPRIRTPRRFCLVSTFFRTQTTTHRFRSITPIIMHIASSICWSRSVILLCYGNVDFCDHYIRIGNLNDTLLKLECGLRMTDDRVCWQTLAGVWVALELHSIGLNVRVVGIWWRCRVLGRWRHRDLLE